MRIKILGPLQAFDGDCWHPVTAGRLSAVLECLVVNAPHPVVVERVVDQVWGDRPPASAPTQVYGYVRRLRTLLGDRDGTLIRTCGTGYQLATDTGTVDADVFEDAVRTGLLASRAGLRADAVAALDHALSLWCGEPFGAGGSSAGARRHADRLGGLWLTATECRLQAEIDCGRHEPVVDRLRDLVAMHPLREQLRRQLLVSLYRSGRLAEALHEYERLRRTLAEELGTDPSTATRAIHQQILDGTLPPATAGAEAPAVSPWSGETDRPVTPVRQLPPDLPDFTGRAAEVAELSALVTGGTGSAPTIVVLHGAPGTGKSTLAVHVSRRVRESFPDVQFHLDLAGTSSEPRDPGELMAEMLHALGHAGRPLPDSAGARAALLRSHLGGRRAMVVLDDAASAHQVQPLLPPDGGSVAVVTSRHLLADLPGARRLHLGPLDAEDAEHLICRIVGASRTVLEPSEPRTIAQLCGYLPLSIRIAGGKLVSRPNWPLRALRERLADESQRLAELSLGDLDVRASVDLSLRTLPDDVVLGYDLLGLLRGGDQPGWVLAALLGRRDSDVVMDRLVDASLVQAVGYDAVGQPRFRLHDLLRSYAEQRAAARGPAQCRAAVGRLLDAWTQVVDQARRLRPPSLFDPIEGLVAHAPGRWPVGCARPQDLVEDPAGWLHVERRAVLGALALGRDWGLAEHCHRLAAGLAPLYDEQGLYDDWRASHEIALACDTQSPLARASLWRGLGQALIYPHELDLARDHLGRALSLFRAHGHRIGAALTLAGLATVHRHEGRLDLAEECVRSALPVVVEHGDTPKEALLLGALGRVLVAQGREEEARPWFTQALELARASGDVHRVAVVLRDLGDLEYRLGRTCEALEDLDQALQVFTDLRDERCVAYTLLSVGRIHVDLADRERATTTLTRAAGIFHRSKVPSSEKLCQSLLEKVALVVNHAPAS